MGAPHDLVVVLRGSQQADQPQVAVVLGLAGTLRRVDEADVGARVRRDIADIDPRQRRIPPRCVVGALPGVVDGDEPRPFRVAPFNEVAVPREELRVERARASDERATPIPFDTFGARDREDPPHRDRMHRWLDETARRHFGRRGAHVARAPEVRTRPVIGDVRVEDDVRDAAVGPLRREEMLELLDRPRRVEMREADRDERAIPAPLVRIQTRRRLGPATHDRSRAAPQRRRSRAVPRVATLRW